jgi:hypothetical protein
LNSGVGILRSSAKREGEHLRESSGEITHDFAATNHLRRAIDDIGELAFHFISTDISRISASTLELQSLLGSYPGGIDGYCLPYKSTTGIEHTAHLMYHWINP